MAGLIRSKGNYLEIIFVHEKQLHTWPKSIAPRKGSSIAQTIVRFIKHICVELFLQTLWRENFASYETLNQMNSFGNITSLFNSHLSITDYILTY